MKTAVITGANSGIGLATAKKLEQLGYRQIWLVRNIEKTQQIFIKERFHTLVTLIECDLADMQSVKRAAEKLMNVPKIDVLINNAGEIFDEKKYTKDGFELTFATNYLGHYMLTNLIMDKLLESKSRVIFLSSEGYRLGTMNLEELAFRKKSFIALKVYGDVKLAIMNFMYDLHRKYAAQGLSVYALHPGVVDTDFAKNKKMSIKLLNMLMKPFLITPEKAAELPVYLATEPDIEKLSGSYFKDGNPVKIGDKVTNPKQAKALMEFSEKLVKPFLAEKVDY